MLRRLRKGVLFTLLFAGVATPAAAADPILMFLLGFARNVIERELEKPRPPRAPEPVPDSARAYPGTTVQPDQLRRLIDDSFMYLNDDRRKEIFDSLHEALTNPKNGAVRSTMIEYFAQKALAVRAAQAQLAQMSSGEKANLAAEFRKEIHTLPAEEQEQLGKLLRNGLLPIPSDLNQMLLAAFDAPR